MNNHKLKIWPEYFTAMAFGNKSFEVRENDRDFKNGDYLTLKEWDPETKEYTGRSMLGQVTYILNGGKFGIPKNMVIMSVVMA